MARRKQSRGPCGYCGQEMAKGGMPKHLSTCTQRQKVIAEADQKRGEKQSLYHLRVQDTWQTDFWLDLEMNGTATLKDLDYYLRAIWLECCPLAAGAAKRLLKRDGPTKCSGPVSN